ncbi:hypothetical protein F4780DRAFT_780424 [Xylariomycetidae sp. FL0641]|nr:hypothetical protein F4780DRAFT_780424 [Xylariomycetidae sp. FL0641]
MSTVFRRSADGDGGSRSPSEGIVVSDDNQNPILQTVTWLLLAVSSLVIGGRLLTKLYIKARTPFVLEDVFMLSAFFLFLGESIVQLVPASTIFGKDRSLISTEELVAGTKAGYVRDLLFLLCLALSKLSVCESLRALSPDRAHRRWSYVLGLVIILWGTTSFFVTAFQCGDHGPWEVEATECIDRRAFLEYVNITSVLTDVGLLALPFVIVYPLQMAMRLRLIVLFFFSMRVCVAAATICQLVYLPRLSEPNYTLRAFPYWLSMQFVLFASILSACVIYFLPFLHSVQSGLLSANPQGLTPQLTLTNLSKAHNRTTHDDSTGRSRNRRDYVEIRTDIAVVHEGRAKVEKHDSGMGTRNAETEYHISC